MIFIFYITDSKNIFAYIGEVVDLHILTKMTDTESIIAINKHRFYDFYYETRDDYVIQSGDSEQQNTYSKPPTHVCTLVKRVFDNYLITSDMNDSLKIIEVLRFCNNLITNGDIFDLINVSSMNVVFTLIYNYGLILSELENGGIMIKNILCHINSQKLKTGILECLIYIVYKNLADITGVVSRTNSHDVRTLSVSSSNDISSSLADSVAKSSSTSTPGMNIYNYICQWVFAKYKSRMFWITPELYTGCVKLLRYNTILSEESCALISQTLKYFIRNDLLISKVSLPNAWCIDYELVESLNMLKNKILSKDIHWIKPLLKQYQQVVPVVPESGQKQTLILIDGANWFYNPKASNGKSSLLRDEIDSIGTPEWNESIINRIRTQMRAQLAYEPTEYFIKNLRIVIVFNERHKIFIHQICEDLDQFIIYTPRGLSDDAMLLYLWLSNPGAMLFSNDQYNDWSNHVTGNHYLMGLWAHWTNTLKICK